MEGHNTEVMSHVPAEETSGMEKTQPNMRKLRLEANWMNMVIALGACVLLMVVALVIAPQPKGDPVRTVDAQAIGARAAQSVTWPVAVFATPEGWHANEAQLTTMGDPSADTWYASYVGPDDQWMSIRQAPGSKEWAESLVEDFQANGSETFAGVSFEAYTGDQREQAYVAQVAGTWLVIQAVAQPDSVDAFAGLALDAIRAG